MQARVIYSAAPQTPASSPEVRHIVTQVYTSHDLLPSEWTTQRQRDFLDREASRLSSQIEELATELGEQAVQHWMTAHGSHPDYLTKVGLLTTASASAKEIVLSQQLYELIPPPLEDLDQTAPMPDPSALAWDRRWTHTQYRTEPTDDHDDLVATVWPAPDFSAVFRIKAGYLIAARAEDHQPLPVDRHDPLADQLAQLVYADLHADGLPVV